MKGLNAYICFAWAKFAEGKKFVVVNCSSWKDYATEQHLGTKVEVVISEDQTKYASKNGEPITNLYEKLTFKVSKDIKLPAQAIVEPINVTATVYGQYRNQLSVKCDDVKVLSQPQRTNAVH